LRGDRVSDALEVLLPHEDDRAPRRGVAAETAGVVLTHAILERAARDADVIGSVGAAEDVDVDIIFRGSGSSGEIVRPSTRRPPSTSAQGEGAAAQSTCPLR